MSRLAEARAALAEHRHEQTTRTPSLFDPVGPDYLQSVERNAGEQWITERHTGPTWLANVTVRHDADCPALNAPTTIIRTGDQ